MSLAARGDLESFQNLFNDGYDHVLNITDPDNNTVIALCKSRGHTTLLDFLEGLQGMEVILLQIWFFYCLLPIYPFTEEIKWVDRILMREIARK